ncbi:MAG: hypothetical protein GSR80_000825 [Desulfurococcales archaeon]|nr:hypothetical protein [Desulfurococcales archaeon]
MPEAGREAEALRRCLEGCGCLDDRCCLAVYGRGARERERGRAHA